MGERKLEERYFDVKKRRMEKGKTIYPVRHSKLAYSELEEDQNA